MYRRSRQSETVDKSRSLCTDRGLVVTHFPYHRLWKAEICHWDNIVRAALKAHIGFLSDAKVAAVTNGQVYELPLFILHCLMSGQILQKETIFVTNVFNDTFTLTWGTPVNYDPTGCNKIRLFLLCIVPPTVNTGQHWETWTWLFPDPDQLLFSAAAAADKERRDNNKCPSQFTWLSGQVLAGNPKLKKGDKCEGVMEFESLNPEEFTNAGWPSRHQSDVWANMAAESVLQQSRRKDARSSSIQSQVGGPVDGWINRSIFVNPSGVPFGKLRKYHVPSLVHSHS